MAMVGQVVALIMWYILEENYFFPLICASIGAYIFGYLRKKKQKADPKYIFCQCRKLVQHTDVYTHATHQPTHAHTTISKRNVNKSCREIRYLVYIPQLFHAILKKVSCQTMQFYKKDSCKNDDIVKALCARFFQ